MNRERRPMDMDSVLAPVGGVVSGGMYRTGDLFWVANDAAAAGVIVGRILKGHISLPKAAVSVADGDDAYFDEDNGVLTNVNSGTLLKVGKFTEAAAAEATEAFCLFGSESGAVETTFANLTKDTASTAPVYGDTVPTTQTGNGSVSLSGSTAKRAGKVYIEITTAGVVGTAVFKWKIGDESYTTAVTTSAHCALGSTGIFGDFVNGLQGAGVDSFEVGDIFETDVTQEATCDGQHNVITMDRITPTLIEDQIIVRNELIGVDSDLIVGSLPVAGTRTTGTPSYNGHTCYDGYAVIAFKNTSLSAENGTSKAAVTII
ncbi:MAG: DUF2190 family protein [Acidobacteria bacterium]|nr:DUF2190 family protein [Acidobacteriota bacterium]